MVLAQPQLIYRICRALRGEVLHGLVGVRVKDQTEVFEPHQCGVDLKRYLDEVPNAADIVDVKHRLANLQTE